MLLKIKRNLHQFSNICQLHLIGTSLIIISSFFEIFEAGISINNTLYFAVSLIVLKIYYYSLKKLQYTYWSITILVVFSCIPGILDKTLYQAFPIIGFLTLKCIEIYLVSSPIFYPWFNWWAYDFRYRDDLKVFVVSEASKQEARISDIRRHASCVTLFEKMSIGSYITVSTENKNPLTIKGRIISVRETTLGRGYSHGVSFDWEDKSVRKSYIGLKKVWNDIKSERKRAEGETRDTQIQ